MKKYLFGVLAIALAVGFSAFTKKPKSLDETFFLTIQPTNATNIETVTNLSVGAGSVNYYNNWETNNTLGVTCTSADNKVCQVEVDDDYVIDIDPTATVDLRLIKSVTNVPTKLGYDMTIVPGSSGFFKIDKSADLVTNTIEPLNRP